MSLLELAQRADPVTWVTLVVFWARWELWTRRHRKEHEQLQALVPHEVTHG